MPKVVLFDESSILSNFYRCDNKIVSGCMESNYTEVMFQAAKFDYIPENSYGSVGLFRAKSSILAKNDPIKARFIAIDSLYAKHIDPKWRGRNVDVMRKLIAAKLESNREEVMKALGTDEILVENSVDEFWSCGVSGKGQNMLGKLWMELREQINKK